MNWKTSTYSSNAPEPSCVEVRECGWGVRGVRVRDTKQRGRTGEGAVELVFGGGAWTAFLEGWSGVRTR
jgi:hypothetical protein